jgi:hypothetical protein
MTAKDALDLSRAGWRKSRHSADAANCVETLVVWRRSRRSADTGNCVEAAELDGATAQRDRAPST